MAVQHTSNPVHVYELSWTIDNFSRTPLVLRGPSFFPQIPGCKAEFCLEITIVEYTSKQPYSWFYVDLICLDGNVNHININCNTTFPNANRYLYGRSLFARAGSTVRLVSEGFQSLKKEEIKTKWGILEDKLIMKLALSFSGYNIKSSTSSSKSNDQEQSIADRKDLIKDLRTMYESAFAWDVTFFVDGQDLHAHKNIICSRSPVFAKMFSIDMQEKNTNTVPIQDANVHVFNCFLLYLYTSMIEDKEWDTMLGLYSLANKYEVGSLLKECSVLLANNLTVESVCNVLMLADLHDDKDLKEAGKKFLKTNLLKVVGTTQWADLITTKPQLAKESMEYVTK